MPAVVIVVDRAGRRHQLLGRAASVVLHVVARQERINDARSGRLVFDFGTGCEVKPSLLEDWDQAPS